MSENEYFTNDLYLSSFLISLGKFKLKELKDAGNGRKVFVFHPKPDQSVILGFYSGESTVSALKLLESLQSLKAATYSLNSKQGVVGAD